MKKRILQCLSLILCAAMLAIPAAAAETADEEAPARLGPAAYWGTVTWMDEDTFLLDSGKQDGLGDAVVVHVGDAPYLDAVTGNTLNLETLEDGDAVYAWVGPAMALSLPPQSTASLIVGNIPADYAVPQYYEITSSTVTEESAVLHVAGSNDTITVPASAKLTPYLTKNIVTLADLRPGARILVWSDSKGTPEKVLVFPYEYRGYLSCSDDGTVSVNGAVVAQKAKTTEDGDTLLPVRAVAEALGMKVHWDAKLGAVVSIMPQSVLGGAAGDRLAGGVLVQQAVQLELKLVIGGGQVLAGQGDGVVVLGQGHIVGGLDAGPVAVFVQTFAVVKGFVVEVGNSAELRDRRCSCLVGLLFAGQGEAGENDAYCRRDDAQDAKDLASGAFQKKYLL